MEKIKLAILDDNPLYLYAFADVLSLLEEFEILISVSSLKELFESLADAKPDIIIVDYEMWSSEEGGCYIGMMALYPEIAVLLMSFHHPIQLVHFQKMHPKSTFLSKGEDLAIIANKLVYISNYCDFQSRDDIK
jgi:DNA-binding NarL/FixJ family response regulator